MSKPVYLIIVPFFPSKNRHWGSYLYDQAIAIKSTNRYNVVVIRSTSNIINDGDYEFGGLHVYRFKEKNLPSAMWDGFFDRYNYKSFEFCLNKNGISIDDIAVVHAHVFRQGSYARKLKQKNPKILTILQHHGYDVLGLNDGIFSKYSWHKRHVINYGSIICNSIDLHVGVSEATLDSLKQHKGICVKDDYVLYNGVDMSQFHPLSLKKNSCFTIGCVANFWKIKDHITLIKAIEHLTHQYRYNVKAILIGTGAELETCKSYVETHNLSDYIEFRDHMPHNKLINFYNELDLFVLPSHWDTLGCVYLEAYACGVPFMSAEGSGIIELIPKSERHLWIAPKSNPERLATMIKNYIDSRPAQHLIKSIDIKDTIADFINLIDQKINNC